MTTARRFAGLLAAAARPWVWALAGLGAALIACPPQNPRVPESAGRLRPAVAVDLRRGDDGNFTPPRPPPVHMRLVRLTLYGRQVSDAERDRDRPAWTTHDFPRIGVWFERGFDVRGIPDRDGDHATWHRAAQLQLSVVTLAGWTALLTAGSVWLCVRRGGELLGGRRVARVRRWGRPWLWTAAAVGAACLAGGHGNQLIGEPGWTAARWEAAPFPHPRRFSFVVQHAPAPWDEARYGERGYDVWETRWFSPAVERAAGLWVGTWQRNTPFVLVGERTMQRTTAATISLWWFAAAGLLANAVSLWRERRRATKLPA